MARRGMVSHIADSDDPTVKTVSTEDSAARAGLVIAFVGILLAQLTGEQVWQAIARIDEGLRARFPAVDQLFLDATARTDRRVGDRRQASEGR